MRLEYSYSASVFLLTAFPLADSRQRRGRCACVIKSHESALIGVVLASGTYLEKGILTVEQQALCQVAESPQQEPFWSLCRASAHAHSRSQYRQSQGDLFPLDRSPSM